MCKKGSYTFTCPECCGTIIKNSENIIHCEDCKTNFNIEIYNDQTYDIIKCDTVDNNLKQKDCAHNYFKCPSCNDGHLTQYDKETRIAICDTCKAHLLFYKFDHNNDVPKIVLYRLSSTEVYQTMLPVPCINGDCNGYIIRKEMLYEDTILTKKSKYNTITIPRYKLQCNCCNMKVNQVVIDSNNLTYNIDVMPFGII